MDEGFTTRTTCMREISELVGEDAWTARYGLLKALERLDLRGVNEVLDELQAALDGPRYTDSGLLSRLRKERWG